MSLHSPNALGQVLHYISSSPQQPWPDQPSQTGISSTHFASIASERRARLTDLSLHSELERRIKNVARAYYSRKPKRYYDFAVLTFWKEEHDIPSGGRYRAYWAQLIAYTDAEHRDWELLHKTKVGKTFQLDALEQLLGEIDSGLQIYTQRMRVGDSFIGRLVSI